MESKEITIKDGRGEAIFDATEWVPNEFAVNAIFQFNNEDRPQPESVRKVYGEYGEKLTGDNLIQNHKDGFNGEFETITAYYPSEEEVLQARADEFKEKMMELIELSDGIIVKIGPKYRDQGWSIVQVTVSDSWYYAKKFEQERFAESVGNAVTSLVTSYGVSKTASVYFEDSFGKTVAEPKLLGGYKIIE